MGWSRSNWDQSNWQASQWFGEGTAVVEPPSEPAPVAVAASGGLAPWPTSLDRWLIRQQARQEQEPSQEIKLRLEINIKLRFRLKARLDVVTAKALKLRKQLAHVLDIPLEEVGENFRPVAIKVFGKNKIIFDIKIKLNQEFRMVGNLAFKMNHEFVLRMSNLEITSSQKALDDAEEALGIMMAMKLFD